MIAPPRCPKEAGKVTVNTEGRVLPPGNVIVPEVMNELPKTISSE
jgi:hypothetical protein